MPTPSSRGDYSAIFNESLKSVNGVANTASTFTDALYKDKLDAVTEEVKGIDPKDASITARTAKMKGLSEATKGLADATKGITGILGDFKVYQHRSRGGIRTAARRVRSVHHPHPSNSSNWPMTRWN